VQYRAVQGDGREVATIVDFPEEGFGERKVLCASTSRMCNAVKLMAMR